jgi:UDPglucose--hexose-1-phosphate uridylyltransferase
VSSWRFDTLNQRAVRIAPARAERPSDFGSEAGTRRCPFCAGAEADTPAEVDRVDDAAGQWLTRVVPNQYPAVDGADGVQEVVIESPRHVRRLVDLTDDELAAAVACWARRLLYWRRGGRFDYALLFKNEGPAAGASLQHVHSQLIALPTAPASAAAMWDAVRRGDLPQGESAIVETATWELVSPAAPRFAYECWWRPKAGEMSLESLADGVGAGELAQNLRRIVAAVTTLGRCDAYNLIVQVPPASLACEVGDRWWIEVVPRSAGIAGLELATGLWVNPVGPEEAAQRLVEELALKA